MHREQVEKSRGQVREGGRLVIGDAEVVLQEITISGTPSLRGLIKAKEVRSLKVGASYELHLSDGRGCRFGIDDIIDGENAHFVCIENPPWQDPDAPQA